MQSSETTLTLSTHHFNILMLTIFATGALMVFHNNHNYGIMTLPSKESGPGSWSIEDRERFYLGIAGKGDNATLPAAASATRNATTWKLLPCAESFADLQWDKPMCFTPKLGLLIRKGKLSPNGTFQYVNARAQRDENLANCWNWAVEMAKKARAPIAYKAGDGINPVGFLSGVRAAGQRDRTAVIGRKPTNWDPPDLWKRSVKGDLPFDAKPDAIVWRGATTGGRKGNYHVNPRDHQRANLVRRIPVLREKNASIYDIAVSHYVQGVRPGMFGPEAPLPEVAVLNRGKMVAMAQGNDVATGLKAALWSSSAVVMPRPTFSSWLGEEKLEAWVHYVPVAQDFSDLEERVAWCLAPTHRDDCRAIGRNGRLWMDSFSDTAVEDRLQASVARRAARGARQLGLCACGSRFST